MGGLLGLGLGMSFISVIELFYFLFYRRIFLWLRTNWSTHKRLPQNQTTAVVPQHSFRTSTKSKKSPPSSPTVNPSSSSIWFLSLDGHSQLVRRGSVNLPSQIQARAFKYWWSSRISRLIINSPILNLPSNVNIWFCMRRTKRKYEMFLRHVEQLDRDFFIWPVITS